MTTVRKALIKKAGNFIAELGDYRETKVNKVKDPVHGIRIATGKTWDMDHFITHGLICDGYVFIRKKSIQAEVNADRYDKTDFILSLGKKQAPPKYMPGLDQDRVLLEWIEKQGGLVMVMQSKCAVVVGTVLNVGDQSCTLRVINDEVEVAEELMELPFSKMRVLVVGTHILKLFDKYIVETGQT